MELGATGFSMSPRSCPWPVAKESSTHPCETVLGPFVFHSTQGIQEIGPRKVDRAKTPQRLPPDMVRVLLQP
jgi:hypothetical protein